MPLNICVIDDNIPVTGEIEVDESECISQSFLRLIRDRNKWDDTNIKNLIDQLIADSDTWRASGFTSPEIYLKAIENGIAKPDIVVFDWEYKNPGPTEVGELLLRVLEKSFVLVYIYTGGDHREQVEERVRLEDLKMYMGNRLRILMKDDGDSVARLLGEAKELYTTNFSFKFSRLLRDATRESIEKVLIRLGEYDIDFVKDFLSGAETTETELKTLLAEKITANILENETVLKELSQGSGLDEGAVQNLLDIIKAKFTDEINSADLDCEVDGTGDTDLTKLKELWSYRLYYKPSDNVVRNGDIIKSNDGGGYFLVTTPNCNLHRFWHKNFGYINLIRLLEITEEGDKIKDHLSLTRNMGGDGGVKKTIKNTKPTSVCNTPNGYPEGCFVLPFVDCAGVSSSLVGFPCAITSINIEPRPLSEGGTPKCRNRDLLRYSQWDDFERIATISEPFLAPIIQNAIGAISGQGVPDYPKRIKMAIKQEFESFHNDL